MGIVTPVNANLPPSARSRSRKRVRSVFPFQIFLALAVSLLVCLQWIKLILRTNFSALSAAVSRIEGELLEEGVEAKTRLEASSNGNQRKSQVERITSIPESFPQWLRDYVIWHAEQRKKLTPGNWNATGHRYLVMTCMRDSLACGGLSDRLQHIPTMVHMAAKTNRMLLIYWEHPAALEEFLVPRPADDNIGLSFGLDWRVPKWMVPLLFPPQGSGHGSGCIFIQKVKTIAEPNKYKRVNESAVCTRSTMHRHGQGLYDDWLEEEGEPTFVEIYHDLWRFLFASSPPVSAIISEEMEQMKLQPGKYVMAHVRALYAKQDRDDTVVQDLTKNAVHCALQIASRLRSSAGSDTGRIPIFFASDSSLAVEMALKYGNGTVVAATKPNAKPALHLDRAKSSDPSDYYNIFVDLLLLGNSRCATFNIGGFGRFAALIGYPLYDNDINKKDPDKETDGFASPCWVKHHKHDCINEEIRQA